MRIKNQFHINSFELGLSLKKRLEATRKWVKLDNNPEGGAGYGKDGQAVNLLSSKPVAVNN